MWSSAMMRVGAVLGAALIMSACTVAPPQPREESSGHLGSARPAPDVQAAIPQPVKRRPFVPLPVPAPPQETFTVVVSEVPVRELLFALARDANINVDVHPAITGNVTLNAIDQSLYQILDRITRQLSVRYENRDNTLVIMPDAPFLRSYRINYVNVTRDGSGSIGASSALRGQGEAQFTNTSGYTIGSTVSNKFWETLETTLDELVNQGADSTLSASQKRVIVNPEGGLVFVRATTAQHELVQEYLDQLMANVGRQVLIEATIVEVQLNDDYQAGIDWQVFTRQGGLLGAGITLGTNVGNAFEAAAGASGVVTGLIFNAADAPTGSAKRTVEVSINLLNEFGDTKVLSSPRVMALNNQPAILKVVDNQVYFEIKSSVITNEATSQTVENSEIRTVSVGLVMSVTPQISEADNVTLVVRPSVSRIREFAEDPVNAGNLVPVVQVRETESVMKVASSQLAVLGGLMQDEYRRDDNSVPGFSQIPILGEAFNFRRQGQTKTELVVFLRPTVIRTPDVNADLADFRAFLPENLRHFERQKVPFVPLIPEQGRQP